MIASHFSWRDNDQQNQWVQWGTQHFQTHPCQKSKMRSKTLSNMYRCFSVQTWEIFWHPMDQSKVGLEDVAAIASSSEVFQSPLRRHRHGNLPGCGRCSLEQLMKWIPAKKQHEMITNKWEPQNHYLRERESLIRWLSPKKSGCFDAFATETCVGTSFGTQKIIKHHQTSAFGKPFLGRFLSSNGSPQKKRCQVMTETLKGTANETGFEMAMASPLLEHFAAAYDGQHPLLDAGRGSNGKTKGGDGEDSKCH